MNVEIIQTLLQASGAAGVTLMFVWYLSKRDKGDKEMIENFNNTITTHLNESNHVQKELAAKLQQFSDTNRELTEANHDLRNVIQALYKHNLSQVRKINAQNVVVKNN